MAAKSRRARVIRKSDEFDGARLKKPVRTPRGSTGIALTSWTLAQIFAARDAQLRGQFSLPARMAESMRTDDALAVALENRLAPQRCIKTKLVPASGARGAPIAAEAEALYGDKGVGLSADTRASVHACLTNHEVAFGICTSVPREDGSRVDVIVNAWPIEHVRWDPIRNCFMTRIDPSQPAPLTADEVDASTVGAVAMASGGEVPIVHGDGRWVIWQRYEVEPYKHATILAAAIVWARRAFALRDWAKASVAHGSAKVIGALPEGMSLQTSDGALTPEAEALLELLEAVAKSDSPVGIKPAGASLDFLTNNSTAWNVFSELVLNGDRAAARLYLGNDGMLGTNGGAPGVDIASLFGVSETKIQGDLDCISRGIQTGVVEPWCALNFGDSSLAPQHRYLLPDADAEAMKKSLGERTAAFGAALKSRVDARIPLTQADVDGLAADFCVRAPILPVAPPPEAVTQPAAALAVRGFDVETLSTTLSAAQAPVLALLARSTDAIAQLSHTLDGIATIRGKDGVDGSDGADGADGLPGAEGPHGIPGSRGAMGETGPAGPRGPAGAKAEALSGAESYAHFTATLVELRKLGAKLTPDIVRAVAERHGVAALELEAAE